MYRSATTMHGLTYFVVLTLQSSVIGPTAFPVHAAGGDRSQLGVDAPSLGIQAPIAARGKVWHPKPAAADVPIEAALVRIVDFGNDFLRGGDGQPRHHFHCHRYRLSQDDATGLWSPGERPLEQDNSVDVDGDGKLDDVIAYHEFSLNRPFNPIAPWYDTLAGTPRWYGGQTIFQANAVKSGFSEDGVNQDHDGQFAWPRENWAVFHETLDLYSPYRLAANWLWLKHDFLNGGNQYCVTFDDRSRLALLLKRYFMGVESVRFLVRDGQQCYLSEATFGGVAAHTLHPNDSKWAVYEPKAPHDIYFDATQARFESHEFRDVTGVGVYCSKDRFIPAYFGYKWYSFECDAVVHRARRPSEYLAMARVTGGAGVDDFHIGTTEVPYELWKTIFRQARSNNFVPPSQGFGFDKDGDMGSMDYPGADGSLVGHSLQEPVTDITLHDAAAWCNALSDLESREPVYYEDANLTRPLHEVFRSPAFRQPPSLPKLYVKWDADGYRLPTVGEWLAACSDQIPTVDDAVIRDNSKGRTQPIATKAANAIGLYDMLGNVWEMVWTHGDCYDPEKTPAITVMGGDFLYPSDPAERSANPYGDRPYDGGYNIGLRLVRREAGGAAPREAKTTDHVPTWIITKDLITGSEAASVHPEVTLELIAVPGTDVEIAKYETTYTFWKQVHDWASAHGYRTDYDGDMGSMDYWGFDPQEQWIEPPQVHCPDEPVTDVTLYDMAVWCNALSELLGRKPVYYADADRIQVYKTAVKYRPVQFHFPEDYIEKYGKPETDDTKAVAMGAGASASPPGAFAEDAASRVLPSLYVDATADGFRLPRVDEFQRAALGDRGRYSWGDDPQGVFQHDWLFDNAGGTTHSVGQKMPNALGLYDVLGNVSELSSVSAEDRCQRRVRRLGGSFTDLTLGLSQAVRASDAPPETWPYCDTGFRVVRQNPMPQTVDAAKRVPPRIHRDGPVSRPSGPLRRATGVSPVPPWKHGQNAGGTRPIRTGKASDPSTTSPIRPASHVSNDPEPRENGVHVNVAQFDPLQGRAHRGNLYRDGVFQSSGVSSGARIKWSFKTGGAVKSSPVVVDNIAFFGSYDGYVYAVEVANGQEVWRHRTDGPVSGSAAVVNGVVYIASQDGCMVALAVANGKEIWKKKCGSAMAGSPAVAYGAVFIGSGNRGGDQQLVMTAGPMVALDAATGTEIWRGEGGPQGVAAIASDGRRVFGVSSDLYGALDMRDGSRLFDVRAGHQTRQFASMTVAGDKVYAPVATRGAVLCLDASDRVLWQQATLPLNNRLEINNGGIPGYEILGDLAVTSELVFAGCNDGSLHAFSATNGQRVWQFQTNGPVQSSPSVAGHTVYFGSWDGHLYAVNRADGTLRWKLDLGNMPQTSAEQYTFGPDEGGRIVSSPWPAEGAVYVGCDNGYLYAIEGME